MARTLTRQNQDFTKKTLDFEESFGPLNGKPKLAQSTNGVFGKDELRKTGTWITQTNLTLLIIVPFLTIMVLWMTRNWRGQAAEWKIVDDVIDEADVEQKQETNWLHHLFIGFDLRVLIWALASGLAVGIFTWMIIYMDSVEPGINPPTPISPSKLREVSGHNFHMGYVMAIINGVVFFVIGIWWQQKVA